MNDQQSKMIQKPFNPPTALIIKAIWLLEEYYKKFDESFTPMSYAAYYGTTCPLCDVCKDTAEYKAYDVNVVSVPCGLILCGTCPWVIETGAICVSNLYHTHTAGQRLKRLWEWQQKLSAKLIAEEETILMEIRG